MSDKAAIKQALKNFRRLLDLEPEHPGHLEQLARLSVELGRPKDAASYLVERAESLLSRGEGAAAVVDCGTALRLAPKLRSATRMLERAQALVDRHRAAELPAPRPELEPAARANDAARRGPAPMVFGQVTTVERRLEVVPAARVVSIDPERSLPPGPIVDAASLLAVHEADELASPAESVGPAAVPAVSRAADDETTMEREDGSVDGAELLGDQDFDLVEDLDLIDDDAPGEDVEDAELSLPGLGMRGSGLGRGGGARTLDLEPGQIEAEVVLLDGAHAAASGPERDGPDEAELEARASAALTSARGSLGLHGPAPSWMRDGSQSRVKTPAPVMQPELFDAIPTSRVRDTLVSATRARFDTGQAVTVSGLPNAGLVVIVSGRVRFAGDERPASDPPHLVGAGAVLGVVEVVTSRPWMETAVALEPTEVRLLPRALIADWRAHFPRFDHRLQATADEALIEVLLAGSRLFRGLSAATRRGLARRSRPVCLVDGERLWTAGDVVDGLYLVARGVIVIESAAGEPIGRLVEGDCLGVQAALGDGHARVTAHASGGADLYVLDSEEVSALLQDPIAKAAFERLAQLRRVTASG